MKSAFGRMLIQRRFGEDKKLKKQIQRDSITEHGNINKLFERLDAQDKKITAGRPASKIEEEADLVDEMDSKVNEIAQKINLTLSIPPRVLHNNLGLTKEEYKVIEEKIFNIWKRNQGVEIYERNIEIWRQFWITCERSDVIVQIVDARNPSYFINPDIQKMYPNKEHVLLVNKCDLSNKEFVTDSYKCFFYSIHDSGRGLLDYILTFTTKTVGFIGYPNVGKSSTINLVLNQKKVKVSQTPGKTKYIQTILLGDVVLLDCPGLVFPKHDKSSLILHGILNVDQLFNLNKFITYIVDFLTADKLCKHYGLKVQKGCEVIGHMAETKGWTTSRCVKTIIKDLITGKIQYD